MPSRRIVLMLFAAVCLAAQFTGLRRAGGEAVTPLPFGTPVPVHYRPPVSGRVIDPFRPPATAFSAGNRGLEYATSPGEPVRAAGPGHVIFAGQVGGVMNVVVLHADGLRTSYSGLASMSVGRGQAVDAGQRLGTSLATLHLGVRAGTAYLDPAVLIDDAGPPVVWLVPDHGRPG